MKRYRHDVLMDDMDLFDQDQAGTDPDRVTPSVDADGYPFEPIDSFSTDPICFEESVLTLMAEADQLFWISRVLNRHTPKYMKVCRDLENMIRELGSFCVTKAVMEQKGFCFPNLGRLHITMLAMMASFNFRKCHSAFLENVENGRFYGEKTDMVCRWNTLIKRLHATDERIHAIREENKSVDLEGPRKSPDIQTDELKTDTPAAAEVSRPFADGAASLPVDKTAARRMLAETESGPAGIRTDESAAPADPACSRVIPAEAEKAEPDHGPAIGPEPDETGEEELLSVSGDLTAQMLSLYQMRRRREPVPAIAEDPGFRAGEPFRPPPIFRPEGF